MATENKYGVYPSLEIRSYGFGTGFFTVTEKGVSIHLVGLPDDDQDFVEEERGHEDELFPYEMVSLVNADVFRFIADEMDRIMENNKS